MPKTLLRRRVERLQAMSEIREEVTVVRIMYVDGLGNRTPGPVFRCGRNQPRTLPYYGNKLPETESPLDESR